MDQADQKILAQLAQEVPHERTCRVCGGTWPIFQEDIDLLKKIVVPLPTECPDCNHRHRMAFRNEGTMYRRKCDATGKDIVSIYSPDKPYRIYDKEYWHSEAWDPMEFGQEYDSSGSFLEQLMKLLLKVPYPNLMVTASENSDYVNHGTNHKNCYMLSSSVNDENCYFGRGIYYSQNCIDNLKISKSVDCYENYKGRNNNSCIYLINSQNCHQCHFSQNLTDCDSCVLCFNLQHKKYCIRNQQVTKEEYLDFVKNWDFAALKKEFFEARMEAEVRYADLINTENCSGDDISNSRDSWRCFGVDGFNNCRYCVEGISSFADAYYMYACGHNAQLQYNSVAAGTSSGRAICNNLVYSNCQDNYYSYFCNSIQDCFGCVGLKRKQYCILNKQYSQEEYFKLVESIKLDMLARGEYGEFFPVGASHFGYNESIVQEYFPLTKDEALKLGFKWSDYEMEGKYDGSWYQSLAVKEYFDEERAGELLGGVLKCEVTGKPYKIMGPELAFYLKHNIPIPKRSPNQRHIDRIILRNPLKLWHRQCMCEGQGASDKGQGASGGCSHEGRCPNMFETTYAPERSEKVYCEECYRKAVM